MKLFENQPLLQPNEGKKGGRDPGNRFRDYENINLRKKIIFLPHMALPPQLKLKCKKSMIIFI